ncbi:MAG: Fic family protein [Lachnospiraceae bacterium]|jgi:cell filamentation protein|nr:Fic family protein [Lachnospiraceae bacterium]
MNDDPYTYANGVLINKLGITIEEKLDILEVNLTSIAINEIQENPIEGNFDFKHYCDIHRYIFKDIYEWAGTPRSINIRKDEKVLGGLSVEYTEASEIEASVERVLAYMNSIKWSRLSLNKKAKKFAECMSSLWKIHTFREGNTRTTVLFCSQFAKEKGFPLDNDYFKKRSGNVRLALVVASEKPVDTGNVPPNYLEDIIKKCIKAGTRQLAGTPKAKRGWKGKIVSFPSSPPR